MRYTLFEKGNQLLPGLCKPYPGELLTSWLMRLAHNHGMGLREFYRLIWPDNPIRLDCDKNIRDEQIQRLALITNCSYEEVFATTLLAYKGKLFPPVQPNSSSVSWVITGKRPDNLLKMSEIDTGLMFCPKCLIKDGEQPYFRKHWRLATTFVCGDCGCYLMANCPRCRHGNSFIDLRIGCFNTQTLSETLLCCHTCKVKITDTELMIAPWSVRHLQLKINSLIENREARRPGEVFDYFKLLFYITSALLITKNSPNYQRRFAKCLFDMNGICFGSEPLYKMGTSIQYVEVQKRACLIGIAYRLLEQGVGGMQNVCSKASITLGELRSLMPTIPQWYYQSLKHRLIDKQPSLVVNKMQFEKSYQPDVSYLDKNIIHLEEPQYPDYEIDFNQKYYAYSDEEHYLYEDIQSRCCRYRSDYDEDNDVVNELELKSDSWLYN